MIKDIRIGTGYDVHRLVEGRPLIMGGVEIDHPTGLAGHSDADVLIHSIIDALLGALAMGDIGAHFPDDDPNYKNIDSRELLREVKQLLKSKDWQIGNIDSTIVAEAPKMAPHIQLMRAHIAQDLNIDINHVSVKATTSEGIGFEGIMQGISARASAIVFKI